MKKVLIYLTLALIGYGGINCAVAQVMVTQPVSATLQKLKNEGYITVLRIELVNDEYQVHALDAEGRPVDLRVNAHNNEIIAMRKTDSHISMLETVEKIEAVGYSGITLIKVLNDRYEVIAVGPDGKKTKFWVDAASGKRTTRGEVK